PLGRLRRAGFVPNDPAEPKLGVKLDMSIGEEHPQALDRSHRSKRQRRAECDRMTERTKAGRIGMCISAVPRSDGPPSLTVWRVMTSGRRSSWKGLPMPNLPRVMLRAPLRVVA